MKRKRERLILTEIVNFQQQSQNWSELAEIRERTTTLSHLKNLIFLGWPKVVHQYNQELNGLGDFR